MPCNKASFKLAACPSPKMVAVETLIGVGILPSTANVLNTMFDQSPADAFESPTAPYGNQSSLFNCRPATYIFVGSLSPRLAGK